MLSVDVSSTCVLPTIAHDTDRVCFVERSSHYLALQPVLPWASMGRKTGLDSSGSHNWETLCVSDK